METCGARPRSGWYEFDLHFLQHARKMIILKLPGWEESRGILIEKGFAHARQIPVSHMELDQITPLLDQETADALQFNHERSGK